MATFNLAYGNHGMTPAPLEDLATYLRLRFNELGHVFNLTPHFDKKVPNIVVENFDDQVVEIIVNQAKQGVKFAIVATEVMTGNTFNNFEFRETQDCWYNNRPVWDGRYRNFVKVAEACRAIWCLTQDQLEGYAKVLPREWLHLLPIGYVDGFATIEKRGDKDKDFDFLFTGTPTPRRQKILSALQQTGATVLNFSAHTPTFIRNNIVSRAKICLGLKHFDEWIYPSMLRIYYHLMNESFLLSESCILPCVLDDYMAQVPPEKFLHTCIDMWKRDNLSAIAAQNLQRFRDEVPAKPMFAVFLEKGFN